MTPKVKFIKYIILKTGSIGLFISNVENVSSDWFSYF